MFFFLSLELGMFFSAGFREGIKRDRRFKKQGIHFKNPPAQADFFFSLPDFLSLFYWLGRVFENMPRRISSSCLKPIIEYYNEF